MTISYSFILKARKNLAFLKAYLFLQQILKFLNSHHLNYPNHLNLLILKEDHLLLTTSFTQLIKSFMDLITFKAFRGHLTLITIKDFNLPYFITWGYFKSYSKSFMDQTLQIKAFIKIKDLITFMGLFLPFLQGLPLLQGLQDLQDLQVLQDLQALQNHLDFKMDFVRQDYQVMKFIKVNLIQQDQTLMVSLLLPPYVLLFHYQLLLIKEYLNLLEFFLFYL